MNKKKYIKLAIWTLVALVAIPVAYTYENHRLSLNESFYLWQPILTFWLAGLTAIYASYLWCRMFLSSRLLSVSTGTAIISAGIVISVWVIGDALTTVVIMLFILPEYLGTAIVFFIAYIISCFVHKKST